eukprot:1176965-Lingulodinium_polyedra.AAC.1
MRRPALSTARAPRAASAGSLLRAPPLAHLKAHPEITLYVEQVLEGHADAAANPPDSLLPSSLDALRRELCTAVGFGQSHTALSGSLSPTVSGAYGHASGDPDTDL